MATATYTLDVDWEDDDDFTGTGEAIIGDVISPIMASQGASFGTPLPGRAISGRLSCTLKNLDGDYSAFNASSPLTGNLKPRRKVRLTMDSVLIWSGFLDKIRPSINATGQPVVRLTALGALNWVNGDNKINIQMLTNVTEKDILDEILDQAGWPSGDRAIDTGIVTATRFYTESRALFAMRLVEAMGDGFLRETKDGNIKYEDHHFRMTEARSITSQGTYSDNAAAALSYSTLEQADQAKGILNEIVIPVQTFTVASLATLWTHPETGSSSPFIEAGETLEFMARYPVADTANQDIAVDAWTTLVENTDYEANSAADGSGTDMSSDLTVALDKRWDRMYIKITNGGSVRTYITLLQARGTAVSRNDIMNVRVEDTTSQASYGLKPWRSPSRFIPNTNAADSLARLYTERFKDPIALLRMRHNANRSSTHLAEVKDAAVSDRITVTADDATKLGITAKDFFIEGILHEIRINSIHWVDYLLSDADVFSGFWSLGNSKTNQSTRLAWGGA